MAYGELRGKVLGAKARPALHRRQAAALFDQHGGRERSARLRARAGRDGLSVPHHEPPRDGRLGRIRPCLPFPSVSQPGKSRWLILEGPQGRTRRPAGDSVNAGDALRRYAVVVGYT
jgi:hypothetical protein